MVLKFHIIKAILVSFLINIPKILATDCDVLRNAFKYVSSEKKDYVNQELNCCYLDIDFIECDNSKNIVSL